MVNDLHWLQQCCISVGSSPSHMQYLLLDILLPNANIAQLNFTLIKIWMLFAPT